MFLITLQFIKEFFFLKQAINHRYDCPKSVATCKYPQQYNENKLVWKIKYNEENHGMQ